MNKITDGVLEYYGDWNKEIAAMEEENLPLEVINDAGDTVGIATNVEELHDLMNNCIIDNHQYWKDK